MEKITNLNKIFKTTSVRTLGAFKSYGVEYHIVKTISYNYFNIIAIYCGKTCCLKVNHNMNIFLLEKLCLTILNYCISKSIK